MKTRNFAAPVALMMAATACSGILGFGGDSTLVTCAGSDAHACATGEVCKDNKCVLPTGGTSPMDGANSVDTTTSGGNTNFNSSPSGGTSTGETGGSSAAATGGITGTGGVASGGTLATGGSAPQRAAQAPLVEPQRAARAQPQPAASSAPVAFKRAE